MCCFFVCVSSGSQLETGKGTILLSFVSAARQTAKLSRSTTTAPTHAAAAAAGRRHTDSTAFSLLAVEGNMLGVSGASV